MNEQETKKDEAIKANEAYRTNGVYGPDANGQLQCKALEPKTFYFAHHQEKKLRRMRLMGSIRLLGLIGLMGLMGCSGGEDATGQTPTTPPTPTTPTITETAITFSGQQSEEQAVSRGTNRRAGTPLSEKATQFKVWGYKNMSESNGDYGSLQTVFPGYVVNWITGSAASTTSNSSGWEYVAQQTGSDPEQTIKYWDWNAKAYRYFAVTTGAGAPDVATAGQVSFTMTANASPIRDGEGTDAEKIAANIAATPYFSKLWFSTGNVADYRDKQFGKPVTLEFLKPFARVRFLYKYSTPREGFKMTEQKFRPTDDVKAEEEDKKKIARKGTVTVHYPTEGTATKEWYTVVVDADKSTRLEAFTEDFDPDNDTKKYNTCDNGWYWVLPIISQRSYTLTVKVNNNDRAVTVPAEYMTWLPGYSYTYIFKVTEEGGVEIGWVEYAMTPWTEMTATKTVYNW